MSGLEKKVSGLEKSYSELHLFQQNESFWHKADKMAKYVLDLYFKPKPFERNGKLYRVLGVKRFKKFMFNGDYMNALLRKIYPKYRLVKDEDSARFWEFCTRIYEGVHLGGCGLMITKIVDRLADTDYKGAAIYTALNTVVNIYPIMLQRYNRARIYNVLGRALKNTPNL